MVGFKKLVFILLFSIFLISLVQAQETRFNGERNTFVNVTDTCSFNNLPCGASFNCNITILSPSQQTIILNQMMTRDDTLYNYTLNSSQTTSVGVYEVSQVYCSDGSNNGTSSFFFEITPSGAAPIDSGQGFILLGLFLILLITVGFFLLLGILTTNVPFKIFFVSLSTLILIATLGFGATVTQQLFGAFSGIITGFNMFYRLLSILLVGGAIGLIIYLLTISFKLYQIKRGLVEDTFRNQ